jgi:ATP-dependent DNA helicase RecQ
LRYVDASSCRHDFILRYFGDEAESLGGCQRCDVCRTYDAALRDDPEAVERDALVIRKVLSGVARAKGRGGLQAIAEMLRGESTTRVMRFGFDTLSTFGLLAGESQEQVMRIFRALLAKAWVDLRTGDYPTPFLTSSGGRVMRGEEPPRLLLPKPRPKPILPREERAAGKTRKSASSGGKQKIADLGESLGIDRTLLEALRVHRQSVASEAGVPAYVVAHDKTLVELAARRPSCLDDLEDVPGFGPVKIARYGAGFVEIVRRCAQGPPE